jgi:hypothetical protein
VFGCTQENPDVFYLRKEDSKGTDGKTFKKFAWKPYNPEEISE